MKADTERHVTLPAFLRKSELASLDSVEVIDPARAGDSGRGTRGHAGIVGLAAGSSYRMTVSFIKSSYMGFRSGVMHREPGSACRSAATISSWSSGT